MSLKRMPICLLDLLSLITAGCRSSAPGAQSASTTPKLGIRAIAAGGAGMGGRAHAANEYYVIEGAGKIYGLAGAEKSVAATIWNYAHINSGK